MQTRFVVVPAVPMEKETFPRPIGYTGASGAGFDLYDTHCKIRLALNCPTRAEADYECARRNGQNSASGSSNAEAGSRCVGRESSPEGRGSRFAGHG
ncbi:hypothetical protein IAE39_002709 [Pseudomonas sp. S37]|nr:hypothetical protein [Pseudomonas sp. S37]